MSQKNWIFFFELKKDQSFNIFSHILGTTYSNSVVMLKIYCLQLLLKILNACSLKPNWGNSKIRDNAFLSVWSVHAACLAFERDLSGAFTYSEIASFWMKGGENHAAVASSLDKPTTVVSKKHFQLLSLFSGFLLFLSLIFLLNNSGEKWNAGLNMKIVLLNFLIGLAALSCLTNAASPSSAKNKKPKKAVPVLEQVTSDALKDVLEDNDDALVLFYEESKSPNTRKLITTLEKFDLSDIPDVPFVRNSDVVEAEEFGIGPDQLPKVVLFSNSIPDKYDGDVLDIKALKSWVKDELDSTDIDTLDIATMEKVVVGGSPFVIMFVDDPKRELNSEAAVLKVSTLSSFEI